MNLVRRKGTKIDSNRFLDGLHEQAKTKSAWFWAFIFLGLLHFYEIRLHSNTDSTNRQILIPYTVAIGNSKVEYQNDITNGSLYYSKLAENDIMIYGNWNSDTVERSMQMFSSRLHPSLAPQFSKELLESAKINSEREVTQQLIITEQTKWAGDKIKVTALVSQYLGAERIAYENREFIITFQTGADNIPMIVGFDFKKIEQ